jgi:peptide/nickel transport system substrate-binding protein
MKKVIWLFLMCILSLSLMVSSCQSKTPEEETSSTTTSTTTQPSNGSTSTTVTTPPVETTTVSDQPMYGGTMNLLSGDVTSWDPLYNAGPNEVVKSFYFEKLQMGDWSKTDVWSFRGANTAPLEYAKGCLAESWEMNDPLTYTFHLRQGVHWQERLPVNGREVTAADVKYSYDRMLGIGSGFTSPNPYGSFPAFNCLGSITTEGKYTVVFHLKTPSPMFLENHGAQGNIWVIPQEIVAAGPTDWHNAVGSGPFLVSDYVSGSAFTFTANPNYWMNDEQHPENKLPYVDRIHLMVIPDLSTQIAALRTGKIDMLGAVSWQTAAEIKKTNPQLISRQSTTMAYGLATRNDKKPYSDVRVRQALQMALNLPEIAATYFGGTADPFPSAVSSNSPVYVPWDKYPKETQDIYTYNVEKAKELLRLAGYSNGFDAKMFCLPLDTGYTLGPDLAELVKFYWAKINVNVTIEVVQAADLFTRWYSYNYEIAPWGTSLDWNPIDNFSCYQTGVTWNFARVSDSVIDKYIADIQKNQDSAERTRLGKELVMYLTQQVNYVALPVMTATSFWQPWLGGYGGQTALGSGGYGFGPLAARIWVNETAKKAGTK